MCIRKIFFRLLLAACSMFAATRAGALEVIGFIDPFQCSSCNLLSTSLKKHPLLLKKIRFVCSSELATPEQTSEFLYELFGTYPAVVLNDELFRELKDLYKGAKTPYIALYDTGRKQVVRSISIDRLESNIDLLYQVTGNQPKVRYEIIDNPRISKLIGWKSITAVYPWLFAASYQNTSKIYYVDVETKQYDSIFIDDATLQNMYRMCGISHSVADVRAYYDKNDLMMPLYRFSSDLDVSGNLLTTYTDIFFYDPSYQGDTFRAKWYSFFTSFNPASRQLQVNWIQSYENNTSEDEYPNNTRPIYSPDFTIKRIINDSLLLLSCDKVARDRDSVNKTKLLLTYAFDKKANQFRLHSFRDSAILMNVKSFRGKNFNDFHTHFYYNYIPPFLYFAESDQLYDFSTHRQISLKEPLKGADWLFDLEVSESTLTFLCKENEHYLSLYTLDRKTFSLLSRQQLADTRLGTLMNNLESAGKEHKDADLRFMSNLVVRKDHVFYLNKSGKIVHLLTGRDR